MIHKTETLQKLQREISKIDTKQSEVLQIKTAAVQDSRRIVPSMLSSTALQSLYSSFDKMFLLALYRLIEPQGHGAPPNFMTAIVSEIIASLKEEVNTTMRETYNKSLEPVIHLEREHQFSGDLTYEDAMKDFLAKAGFPSTYLLGAYYRSMKARHFEYRYGQAMVVFISETGTIMQYCLSEYFAVPISCDDGTFDLTRAEDLSGFCELPGPPLPRSRPWRVTAESVNVSMDS